MLLRTTRTLGLVACFGPLVSSRLLSTSIRQEDSENVPTPYSHLMQRVYEPYNHHGVENEWRDTDKEHNKVNNIASGIAARAEKNMKSEKPEESAQNFLKNKLPASKWPPIYPLADLRIFWKPTNDVDLVLPKECEPSDQGMERYQNFLAPNYDKEFFQTPSEWPFVENSFESGLARTLYRLNKSQIEGRWDMDKDEGYADDFFAMLREYMNIDNPKTQNFTLLRNNRLVTKAFGYPFAAKPEFILLPNRLSGVALEAFIEKKRLMSVVHDAFGQSVSQKGAEALAIANHGYFSPETAGQSQEVFGIGVRHYYFIFWHGLFSSEYLDSVVRLHHWKGGEHAVLKCYPHSQYGLDFCDPKQRKDILRYIHRILNYLDHSCKQI